MLTDLYERHERFKKKIHSFRLPLSPAGQKFMGFIYFTVPIVIGYFVMQQAIKRSEENLGAKGEKLTNPSIDSGISRNETKQQNQALQGILDRAKAKK